MQPVGSSGKMCGEDPQASELPLEVLGEVGPERSRAATEPFFLRYARRLKLPTRSRVDSWHRISRKVF